MVPFVENGWVPKREIGHRIGFTLKLGTYERVVQGGGIKANPLFGQIAAKLSYKSNTIWEAQDGAVKVEQFELSDFNGDGDTDIRFTIRQETADGFLRGVLILMNQFKPDKELANLEGEERREKPRKQETPREPEGRLGTVLKDLGAVRFSRR